MAGFKKLDKTGNDSIGKQIAKISTMLQELFTSGGGAAFSGTTGTFSGLVTAGTCRLDTGTKTAAATGGAATLNKAAGKITSEALTTAQDALYTLTLTNSAIAAADQVFASLANGTNTQGSPMIEKITPGAGSVVITVRNRHATAEALNGTLVISFFSLKN